LSWMFVCPSAIVEQLGFKGMAFNDIWNLWDFSQICRENLS
jgi:hypothetical protein